MQVEGQTKKKLSIMKYLSNLTDLNGFFLSKL
jgi:hypothetical protein